MDRFWGDNSWQKITYQQNTDLFGEVEEKKVRGYKTIVEKFRERLKDAAGFKYVPAPLPMRNTKGGIVYYLFFASQNNTGGQILKSIFRKYEKYGLKNV